MTYQVVSVSHPRDRETFLKLPHKIYSGDSNWVAPMTSEVRRTLDVRRNPYFKNASLQLFLCLADDEPVSRLAVVINKLHQKRCGSSTAFFGFFEAKNDPEAMKALIREAEDYCWQHGVRELEGPFNPNHYSELGLQADRFGTPPAFFQTFNPSYYGPLLEHEDFHVAGSFQTMKNDDIGPYLLERYGPPASIAERDGYAVRSFRPYERALELERIREVNNDAFDGNWRFLPLTREEYVFSARYLSLVTEPELIQIVEHRGRPVAVLHCVLDINPLLRRLKGRVGPFKYLRFMSERHKVRSLIIFTVAIKKAYQHSRVYYYLLQAFRRMAEGYRSVETTWLSPENLPALKAAESLGMVPDKHFAIYAKSLRP
jgi:hypothetical protein